VKILMVGMAETTALVVVLEGRKTPKQDVGNQ
jgi:hypothetical protein